jgi:hypothetical protein
MLVWIVGGCAMLAMCNSSNTTRTSNTTNGAGAQSFASCNVNEARKLIGTLSRSGLIVGSNKYGVNVDERVWRALSLGQRQGVGIALACDQTNGSADPNTYISVRASDGITRIASGSPFAGSFEDKN